ncbi:hypothetical protein E3N88_36042 [Mikania micrantha]|uniref:Uncharacterized protein n=1 Tax=Mikania micrantha TaxID=192012 RepID=A0A5N6M319_9ASTR|nr:hypothetical protein E3N88_36042 [Mikania micrantha]
MVPAPCDRTVMFPEKLTENVRCAPSIDLVQSTSVRRHPMREMIHHLVWEDSHPNRKGFYNPSRSEPWQPHKRSRRGSESKEKQTLTSDRHRYPHNYRSEEEINDFKQESERELPWRLGVDAGGGEGHNSKDGSEDDELKG